MPLDTFLRKVERAIDGLAVYPPHHVRQVSPSQLPAALVAAKFVFVRKDAVIPTLTPGYRGPYLGYLIGGANTSASRLDPNKLQFQ